MEVNRRFSLSRRTSHALNRLNWTSACVRRRMKRADSISLLFLCLFLSLVETRMLAEIKQSPLHTSEFLHNNHAGRPGASK